jgi:uncharacterized protein YqeY
MKKFKFQRLKIIEQIAIAFFFAVVIPMSISGFIINNINQQSVRHQLRESAALVATMVSDEMDFLIRSNNTTLNQIADALDFLPTNRQKNEFMAKFTQKYPHCEKIITVKTQKELDNITKEAKEQEKPIMSTKLKNGSFLAVIYNTQNMDVQLFKSLENETRQIYILLDNKHLVASHNYTKEVFDETMSMLPEDVNSIENNTPVIFGDEKNQPIVYLKYKDPKYSIIVTTTETMARYSIVENRIKIITEFKLPKPVQQKNGEMIDVEVFDQSMDERISMMPKQFAEEVFGRMAKAHKENLIAYKNNPQLLKKEQFELDIINTFLPKEATKEDVIAWLNENYPNGITQKEMGPTIGKAKGAFARADGKMVSECVRSIIHG